MSNITIRIEGLEFEAQPDGSRPRIRDVDLGKLAQMPRPRDIKPIIKLHRSNGYLTDSDLREVRSRKYLPGKSGSKREVEAVEYWADKVGALKIASKIETDAARDLMSHVINVFVAVENGLVDEAGTRFANRMLLAKAPQAWRRLIEADLGIAICRLYGHAWDGRGTQPVLLSQCWVRVYQIVFGKPAYAEMKRRNPNPSKGSNHHQLLKLDARRLLDDDMRTAYTLARQSRTADEFWQRLSYHYGRSALQLGFGT